MRKRLSVTIHGGIRAHFTPFDKAKRILSLDCDFLGGEEDGAQITSVILPKAASPKPVAV